MTQDNIQIALAQAGLLTRIDTFLASRGFGYNPGLMRRARLSQIIALESQTDAELAAQGLQRDDILPHVFGDLLT